MKIVNKFIIIVSILFVFLNVITYSIDLSFMRDTVRVINDIEIYFICFLTVLSVSSSALIDDRAIVMSNLFVSSGALFLGIAVYNFATGNNIIPSSSSLSLIIEPFLSFIISSSYSDTLSFLFSLSITGLIFTGMLSIVEQPDIKNSISKKIKFVAKAALYANMIVLFIGMIVTSLDVEIGIMIFTKLFYILSEIAIYSALLINIANFGFNVEIVPDSEFVHSNFMLPSGYNINQNRSSNFNGYSTSFGNTPNNNSVVMRSVSNSTAKEDNNYHGVEIFANSANVESTSQPNLSPNINPIPIAIEPVPTAIKPALQVTQPEIKPDDDIIPMIYTPAIREMNPSNENNNLNTTNTVPTPQANNSSNIHDFFKVQN